MQDAGRISGPGRAADGYQFPSAATKRRPDRRPQVLSVGRLVLHRKASAFRKRNQYSTLPSIIDGAKRVKSEEQRCGGTDAAGEKLPPAKQRWAYVPNNTTRTTHARQNPSDSMTTRVFGCFFSSCFTQRVIAGAVELHQRAAGARRHSRIRPLLGNSHGVGFVALDI